MGLPELSRFELQCLRRLWTLGQATVGQIHESLPDAPSYSTVRKIVERLEEKGAAERVRKDGRAWVYRSKISHPAMVRRELQRFIDVFFDGAADRLVSQLAEMDALSVDDLRELERQLAGSNQERS